MSKKKKKSYVTKHFVETNIVRRSNPDFYTYDDMGHVTNNIHNLGTYYGRQWFFFDPWKEVSLSRLNSLFKYLQESKQNCLRGKLSSQICQQVLKNISSNFTSFFKACKKWHDDSSKFTGRPKPPGYFKKGGVCTFVIDNQDFRYNKDSHTITFINSHRKHMKWWKKKLHPIKLDPNLDMNKVGQITVVPHKYYKKLLISYSVKIPKVCKDNHRYMGIDLGVNNLCCIGSNVRFLKPLIINGRPAKSMNQYANKKIANTKRMLMKCNHNYTSHYLDFLFTKRHFKLENYMHEASKCVVEYALNHDISRIIIGNGVLESKQNSNMGKRNNQNFIQIPFRSLVNKIKYKAAKHGIGVIVTEESYTSQTSFLDNEKPCKANGNKVRAKKAKLYNKKHPNPKDNLYKHVNRRLYRGLYRADNGEMINADLDGALQIIKKVKPNAFKHVHGLEDFVIDPLKKTMPN